jgi:hypothetical protein
MTKPTNRPQEDDAFVVFTPANCVTPPEERGSKFYGQLTLSIRKKGVLSFSKALYGTLAADYGTEPIQVQFVQDKERVQDWYIKIVSENGWEIKIAGKGNFKLYKFGNKKLANLIRESMSFEADVPFSMFVARKPVDDEKSPFTGMFPILTKTAKVIVRAPYKTKEKP